MGGKSNEVQETSQQRAMAEYAINQWADWKQRWLPVQKHLTAQIQAMGKPGSAAREAAAGKVATDTTVQFGRAQGTVQKVLANSGARVGSGRFNAAVTGLGQDQATSKGLGLALSDQMVDDAYVQGLSAIAATGRGERAAVADSLGRQAQQSSRQAMADAEAAATERSGNAALIGQFAGYGLQRAMSPGAPVGPAGSVPGGYVEPITGNQFNNPSGFIPQG
jgi:hypothetical protein